jgi:hypothetical protein
MLVRLGSNSVSPCPRVAATSGESLPSQAEGRHSRQETQRDLASGRNGSAPLGRHEAVLHGVVDNLSRRVLAWRLAEKLDPLTTCQVLTEAAKNLQGDGSPVSALTDDSGVENINDTVDEFLSGGIIRRVLAQLEIVESNSLVKAWWRGLRHQWLYLNTWKGAT